MPLDPATKAMLDMAAAANLPPNSAGTPQMAREGFKAVALLLKKMTPPIDVGEVTDIKIPSADGDIPARIYRPESSDVSVPTVVFFHGGGFVIGDIETHDNQARRLCRDVKAVVISVDYRLAPEAPHPHGINDAYAATVWAAANIDQLGNDLSRVAVAGDSAGGNFAAIVAQRCRDEDGPQLAAQLLIYPATDFTGGTDRYPSRVEFAEGYFITLDDMLWFSEQYVGGDGAGRDLTDRSLSPIFGKLEGLPPAVVVVGECDPLRDEGEAYAKALSDAGVVVTSIRFDGLIHGFFDLGAISPASAAAADRTCAELAKFL